MPPLYVCSRCRATQPFRTIITRRTQRNFHSSPAPGRIASLTQAAGNLKVDGRQRPKQHFELPERSRRSQSTAQPAKLDTSDSLIRPSSALLSSENLFHPFSTSPAPDIRQRAQFIKRHAFCPHPSHKPSVSTQVGEDGEEVQIAAKGKQPPAHCKFECPDCGVPLYCSEEHWAEDYESHLKICDTLRQVNEDDHDLRSGRSFSEFEYPGPQIIEEAVINMTNWDTFLYTRQFEAINEMQRLRQATRLLTYPVTVGSVIHELSPYSYGRGGRVTLEGVKSFSALQYTLHPPRSGAGMGIDEIKPSPPAVRIFVLGARAESSLPREVWIQLCHMFPNAAFNIIFIGPDAMMNRESEGPLPEKTPENPFGMVTEDQFGAFLKINTIVDYYHNIHQTGHFAPYDPYFDAFMLYHPGFGNPVSAQDWEPTLPQLLETKVPIICTGFSKEDMMQDIQWLKKTATGEYDMLLEPGENIFRSLKWDLNDQDPADVSCANWGVWAFRGKRYDAMPHEDRVEEAKRIQ